MNRENASQDEAITSEAIQIASAISAGRDETQAWAAAMWASV